MPEQIPFLDDDVEIAAADLDSFLDILHFRPVYGAVLTAMASPKETAFIGISQEK